MCDARRRASQEAKHTLASLHADPTGFYLSSCLSRTIVYKGMFLADQIVSRTTQT